MLFGVFLLDRGRQQIVLGDVYVKKLLIEQLIDKLPEPEHGKKKKEK